MKTEFTSVVILAAGSSRRMHTPKALLPFDKSLTFIEKIVGLYAGWGCNGIVVVVNRETAPLIRELKTIPGDVTVIVNEHTDYERFYSAKIGLQAVGTSAYCFLQDVDNPFIDGEILDHLYANRNPEAYVSPVFQGKGGHPVLLSKKIMDQIRNYKQDDANLKEVLSLHECRKTMMKDGRILININSPEEYERLFDLR